MEKIIISCREQYLGYEFPKRKWYQLFSDRIALMRLDSLMGEELEEPFLLRIYEKETERIEKCMGQEYAEIPTRDFICEFHPLYRKEICLAMIKEYHVLHEYMEHAVLFDPEGEVLPELAYDLAKNRNYLTILTEHPEKYDRILERIEMEFGLSAMVYTEAKAFMRYLKTSSKEKKLFVSASDSVGTLLYRIPKNSVFLDFSINEIHRSRILKKRMQFTYLSIPIFLDNTVKNRYNAVVNEGITFQVIKYKKTTWRRKGS